MGAPTMSADLSTATDCELIYQGAYYIMKIRNAGQPLDEMLSAFNSGDLRAITIRAYDRRQGLWTPTEFANEEMVACEKLHSS